MKSFLHKITKVFLILIFIMVAITVAIVGWLYFSNQSKLQDEASLLSEPPGQMIEVDGHRMHVYITGKEDAEHSIVFLHGTGMSDASIAMQPLFNKLSEQFRVIYVDRPGNGYSEEGCNDKSVENLTEETREAISKAGVSGELILFAQTTGGIEACYWAQAYPEEVKAVIGLDMAYSEEYASYNNEEGGFKYMMYLFAKIGVTRHIDSAYPDDRYNLYSDKQITVRKALISRGSYTKDMYEEDKVIGDNARETETLEFPEKIPMLLMLSNPIKEPYLSTDANALADLKSMKESYPEYDFETAYNEGRIEHFKQYGKVDCVELPGPSALYTYAPEQMAEQIIEFVTKKVE